MTRITEERNPASKDLDLMTVEEILELINTEDQKVAAAVREVIPQIARAVNASTPRIRNGGRVFYVGAGTSGRLGVLDASEIPPTFGLEPDRFQGVIAGGYEACHAATETSEDEAEQGARDLEGRGCTSSDVVVGIAASGDTPYTLGALQKARDLGALTISVCCNPGAPLSRDADFAVTPVVGPEVVSGSTRMKAGTAQKLVLNMFSTAIMVQLGHVYSNWMINVQMRNAKLQARGMRILSEITGREPNQCGDAMRQSGGDLRVALIMLLAGVPAVEARRSLEAHSWNLRRTLESIR